MKTRRERFLREGIRIRIFRGLGLALCAVMACCGCNSAGKNAGEVPVEARKYPREQTHDTSVGRDEALVNVRLAASGWPDCHSMESAIRDIWRLEGTSESSGEEKALALWKWLHILVSGERGEGGYVFEGEHRKGRPVLDPHRILTAYGHHMRGRVYRHILARRGPHSLRTSLRVGERIVRSWDNPGHVIPAGKEERKSGKNDYYTWRAGRSDGVYAAVGEEVQTLEPAKDLERYASVLYDGSANTACSPPEKGKATLHPAEARKPAFFVYRVASPYPVADARIEIKTIKSVSQDTCRAWLSVDGKIWRRIVEQVYVGEKQFALNIGRDARFTRRPDAYSAYGFMVKVECRTENDPRSVGVKDMKVTAFRQLSKRALPHLRPGTNYLRLTADSLAEGLALELSVDYRVNGRPHSVREVVASFPHYFRIDVPAGPERVSKEYDQHWNDGALQMSAVGMKLVPAAGRKLSFSVEPREAQPHFAKSRPHPADMQSSARLEDGAKMNELIKRLDSKKYIERWHAAEDLGRYPGALPVLLEKLPKANVDMTVFICRALAQIKDRRAVGPLLAKWKAGQKGTPGTRYIPDALAAIGDRSVVPHLVAALTKVRFDLRFHVAHALGILGGEQAEAALKDLAKNDPFKAVREEATRALAKLEER